MHLAADAALVCTLRAIGVQQLDVTGCYVFGAVRGLLLSAKHLFFSAKARRHGRLRVRKRASIAESPRRYMRHRSSRAILAGSMPCQANNACASSHHCSNGIIAMLPKTESAWQKANTDDARVVGRLSPAASFWRTPPRRPRADDIGVRIGRAPGR